MSDDLQPTSNGVLKSKQDVKVHFASGRSLQYFLVGWSVFASIALFCFNQFLQARGIVDLAWSRMWLYSAAFFVGVPIWWTVRQVHSRPKWMVPSLVFPLLFAAANMVDRVVPMAQKSKFPGDLPQRSIAEYFLGDFNDYFAYYSEPKLDSIHLKIRHILDQKSASKFVAMLVPMSDRAYDVCLYTKDHYNDLFALNIGEFQVQGPDGPVSSKNYKFSGRIYIYHENFFSHEQEGALYMLYSQAGLNLELRGPSYKQLKDLQSNR